MKKSGISLLILQLMVAVVLLGMAGKTVFAQEAQDHSQLSDGQKQHLQQYIQDNQMVLARKLGGMKYLISFYRPIAAECKTNVTKFQELSAKMMQAADYEKVNGTEAQTRIYNLNAKVYGDMSKACQAVYDAILTKNKKNILPALNRYLSIEKFMLSKGLEYPGRNWLTEAECQKLCPMQQLKRMPNPYIAVPQPSPEQGKNAEAETKKAE